MESVNCFFSWFVILFNGEICGLYFAEYARDAFYAYCVETGTGADFDGEIPSCYRVEQLIAIQAYDLSILDIRDGIDVYYDGDGITLEELRTWKRVKQNDTVYISFMTCRDFQRNELVLRRYMNVG